MASPRPTSDGRGPGPRKAAGPTATREKQILATNRKARHEYFVLANFEAGLKLLGSEVKSLRSATPSLQDGFAHLDRGELWLYNVHIQPLAAASYQNHEPRRARKCLLHARELRKLEGLVAGPGTTVVPLSIYFLGSLVKVELAVGRGKRQYDKREDIKQREADRATRRAVRRG